MSHVFTKPIVEGILRVLRFPPHFVRVHAKVHLMLSLKVHARRSVCVCVLWGKILYIELQFIFSPCHWPTESLLPNSVFNRLTKICKKEDWEDSEISKTATVGKQRTG